MRKHILAWVIKINNNNKPWSIRRHTQTVRCVFTAVGRCAAGFALTGYSWSSLSLRIYCLCKILISNNIDTYIMSAVQILRIEGASRGTGPGPVMFVRSGNLITTGWRRAWLNGRSTIRSGRKYSSKNNNNSKKSRLGILTFSRPQH